LNPFGSAVVLSSIETGTLDAHLELLRAEYGRRLQAMKTAIQSRLAGKVEFSPPGGGFFFWLRLSDGRDSATVLEAAKRCKTCFVPGPAFSAEGGLRDRLRLSFSYHRSEALQDGVQRLADSLS